MESTPHFFKIILADTLRKGRLGIPKKFVRKYGNRLSSSVILRVPSGETWQVELLKSDGEIWLEKGWQEFAEYHSLDHGYFLVFKYDENCYFDVIVFDKTTSEIEYPSKTICVLNQNHDRQLQGSDSDHKRETEDDSSVEILNDLSLSKSGGDITSLPHRPSYEKLKTSTGSEAIDNPALQTLPAGQVTNHATPSGSAVIGNSNQFNEEFAGNVKQITWEETAREQSFIFPSNSNTFQALESAKSFTSSYPFFKTTVHVDCRNRAYVTIPVRFSRAHFQFESRSLTLQIAGRSWQVKVINYLKLAKFCAGWAKFRKANHLKAGDVCIFELIESHALNVCIYKCVHQHKNC